MEMRRNLVMAKAKVPRHGRHALLNLQKRGHPWVGTQSRAPTGRTGWTSPARRPPEAEVLFWVGCSGALVERNVETTQAMARLLQQAGVDFAVLGDEETCTGRSRAAAGQRVSLPGPGAQEREDARRLQRKKVVATCPHCFHNAAERVPGARRQLRGRPPQEFLAELVREGGCSRPRRGARRSPTTTPATWGATTRCTTRRATWSSALRGRRAWRCRAAATRASAAAPAAATPSWKRRAASGSTTSARQEALDTGATCSASSCPFCLQMFDEGVKAVGGETRRMETLDIAELLEQAVAPPSEPA